MRARACAARITRVVARVTAGLPRVAIPSAMPTIDTELRAALDADWSITVASAPRVADTLQLTDRWVTMDMTGARAWPVQIQTAGGAPITVGAVIEGGHSRFVAPTAGDGRRIANGLVLVAGRAVADVAPIAHLQPMEADGGLSIVLDPTLGASIDALPAAPAAPVPALATRRLAGVDAVLDLSDQLGTERWATTLGDTGTSLRFLDLRFSTRMFGVERAAVTANAEADHWLGWIEKEAPLDIASCGAIVDVGTNEHADPIYHARARLPCVGSNHVPTRRLEPVRTTIDVQVNPRPDASFLDVIVEEHAVLTVVGGPRVVVPFSTRDLERDAAGHSFKLLSATLADGREVLARNGMIVLPAPVPDGGELDLRIRWQDTWAWGNVSSTGSRGRATGITFPGVLFPGGRLLGDGAVELAVHLPAKSPIDVILPGTETVTTDSGGITVRSSLPAHAGYVGLTLGEFIDAGDAGPPAIGGHFLTGDPSSVPAFARTALSYYEQLLPKLPAMDLDVAQEPDADDELRWQSPAGVIVLQKMRTYATRGAVTGGLEHFEETIFAHELAHQWWGNRVQLVSHRDDWIHETLAETYATLFGGAAWGPSWTQEANKLHRETCEAADADLSIALTHAEARTEALYNCGPYLVGNLFVKRLGLDAVLGAFEWIQQKYPGGKVSTEVVRDALSATSRRDVGPLVDAWLEDGFRPKLATTWKVQPDGSVAGEVTADVPFATYEVPLWVIHGGTVDEVWCVVKEGRGTWTTPARTGAARVQLDPQQLLIARERRVRELK